MVYTKLCFIYGPSSYYTVDPLIFYPINITEEWMLKILFSGVRVHVNFSGIFVLLCIFVCLRCNVKQEIKCSGNSELLHEKSEKHELVRVVSRTISCSISESHHTSFLFYQCVM